MIKMKILKGIQKGSSEEKVQKSTKNTNKGKQNTTKNNTNKKKNSCAPEGFFLGLNSQTAIDTIGIHIFFNVQNVSFLKPNI